MTWVATAQRTLEVPGNYPTIQSAINASQNKDTVQVSAGTYRENLDFKGKSIRVLSQQGPELTIIDADKLGPSVTFRGGEDTNTVLAGFTLTRGSGADLGLTRVGGGILCRDASPYIANCIITDNHVSGLFAYGGGVYTQGGTPTIANCQITANSATTRGGGLCLEGGMATVFSCQIRLNGAERGGGLTCSGGTPRVINNSIHHNVARLGGGVYCHLDFHLEKTLVNNTIVENQALEGGGGVASATDRTRMTNTILWNNVAVSGPELWVGRDCSICQPAVVTTSHSVVKGDKALVFVDTGATLNWGKGMVTSDPLLVAPVSGDTHLTYPSPCRNAGDNEALVLPVEDFDHDPRIHDGTTDIGADEFAPHLYTHGLLLRGETALFRVVGKPGSPVLFAVSLIFLSTPITIPGIGDLYLDPSAWAIFPLAVTPSTGVLDIPLPVPPQTLHVQLPFQAFSENQLTNYVIVTILNKPTGP